MQSARGADHKAGDEEHNPFAQWEDIGASQEKEMHAKVAKRQTARQAQRVSAESH